jgi:site-specific DNA recombinase
MARHGDPWSLHARDWHPQQRAPCRGASSGTASPIHCRECGGHYASIGRDYLACSAACGSGTCSNRQSIRRGDLERITLDGLRQRLMAPELVEEFVRATQMEINQLRREDELLREVKKRELTEVTRAQRT